ncbi:hypothetical protein C0Q70_21089 [Pomacea canaliculata]|uniref:Uncharacterized protein n=1 Tax=Pomacea canaliculata TaxID=400727 RepID=A0A2T7NBJ0_POMCA|nr:hypothetical protein C0Q70_21089 [Pomacea canaliculata]
METLTDACTALSPTCAPADLADVDAGETRARALTERDMCGDFRVPLRGEHASVPSTHPVVSECRMKEVSYHPFRYGRIVEDIDGLRLRVLFYNEQRPEPYFSYEQLREGNFLCLANAMIHVFADSTCGL